MAEKKNTNNEVDEQQLDIDERTVKSSQEYTENKKIENKQKQDDFRLTRVKQRLEKKALRDLKKEHTTRRKLIKKEQFNKLENLRISDSQKKFYENIVSKQKKRDKQDAELQKIKEEEVLSKNYERKKYKGATSVAGIIGGMVSGKFKSILTGLPVIGSIVSIADSVKSRKQEISTFDEEQIQADKDFTKQQADIAERILNDDGNSVSPQPDTPQQSNEQIKPKIVDNIDSGVSANTDLLKKLIKVNGDGFSLITSTLNMIDKGEDTEEIMERRDAERQTSEDTKKVEVVLDKQAKKGEEEGAIGSVGKYARYAGYAMSAGRGVAKATKGIFKLGKRAMKSKYGRIAVLTAGAGYGIYKGVKYLTGDKKEDGGTADVPKKAIGGFVGAESHPKKFDLDNKATDLLLKTITEKNKNRSSSAGKEIFNSILKELDNIENNFKSNVNTLNDISKKELGNTNIATMISAQDNKINTGDNKIKLVYPNSNIKR